MEPAFRQTIGTKMEFNAYKFCTLQPGEDDPDSQDTKKSALKALIRKAKSKNIHLRHDSCIYPSQTVTARYSK
jgi:hypothetical protein